LVPVLLLVLVLALLLLVHWLIPFLQVVLEGLQSYQTLLPLLYSPETSLLWSPHELLLDPQIAPAHVVQF
tara:strand:- start:164 stop:373 length:210 start_codon:yes stop_codon:yes gene_type:complete